MDASMKPNGPPCQMGHDDDLAERYVRRVLSDADRDVFELHYFNCDPCSALVSGLQLAGAAMKELQIVVFSPGLPLVSVSLGTAPVIIGRAHNANIRLDDPSVSSIHAVVRLGSGGVTIEDYGSTNGTRVNNHAGAAPTIFCLPLCQN